MIFQSKENDDETTEEDEHEVSNESDDDDNVYSPEVIIRKCKGNPRNYTCVW